MENDCRHGQSYRTHQTLRISWEFENNLMFRSGLVFAVQVGGVAPRAPESLMEEDEERSSCD